MKRIAISGYWNKGDAVVSDRRRLNIIAQRFFAEKGQTIHEGQKVSFQEAKDLAIAMLYDYEYREWRTKQEKLPESTP
jgi:hypothetical protein